MTGRGERTRDDDEPRVGDDRREGGDRPPSGDSFEEDASEGDASEGDGTGGRDGRGATGDQLSLDAIHGLLSARRRRYTLYCMYLYDTPMRLRDVAEQVTQWTHGPGDEERSDLCRRTYVDLSHAHVPKLSDAGVVTYSREGDTVELARNATDLRPYLERASETDLAGTEAASL